MRQQAIVIIGNGMVGHKLIEALIGQADGQAQNITVINEEAHLAYDRVHLSSYFEQPAPDLSLGRAADYQAWGVKVAWGKASSIDRANKDVYVGDQRIPYDVLVLATGSYPFVPPVPGKDLAGTFVYRTLEDLDNIRSYAQNSQTGVVIGGGLLGLEAAGALKNLGLTAHVVEFAPRLMPVQVDEAGGKLLKRKIEAMGIGVHVAKSTECIFDHDGNGKVAGLKFNDGTMLTTDLVVFSAGIRPRDELARQSGLEVGERGGIVINDQCRTSDPHIYALGECALHSGRIYGLVAPGYTMARTLADVLHGGEQRFNGADMSSKLKLLGVEVASFGDAFAKSAAAEEMSFSDPIRGTYKKLVLSSDGKRLLGGILVGDSSDYGLLLAQMQAGSELSQPEQLMIPNTGVAQAKAGLPDSATVCSCENVSKGAIVAAIRDGVTDIAGIKSSTKACTGCGGCAALCKDVLNTELLAMGQVVNNHLCEHFSYSRQELYDIIRVRQHQDFEQVLSQHGHGDGCEICKPTVASILASLYSEYVLKDGLEVLQDTNDRFLANIQRDGSYSVVPRMAGGEVTPDGLIAVGRIAKKYRLYTKLTGGQRVDMFGARLEQLPLIWQELIEAGFESGHAYGKALRTVKSCVGSTWCRYGVQDSTAMAVFLENRYKGLRAPHKLKSAVSGCTRECAEAQSKDFGVIATEHGYNLYVCGNGGMKPRHADLLASDLDDQTLVCYIDRFLMFYIRTADRLQRTSVWLDKLPGGLDYLKKVILDDHLGLCAELEADMQRHVEHYQCEWQATLANPDKMASFSHFVNSSEPDDNIVFVKDREQHRPAYDFERPDFAQLELLPMA
jgi:nitrite reductase (NADH) large subunit